MVYQLGLQIIDAQYRFLLQGYDFHTGALCLQYIFFHMYF